MQVFAHLTFLFQRSKHKTVICSGSGPDDAAALELAESGDFGGKYSIELFLMLFDQLDDGPRHGGLGDRGGEHRSLAHYLELWHVPPYAANLSGFTCFSISGFGSRKPFILHSRSRARMMSHNMRVLMVLL